MPYTCHQHTHTHTHHWREISLPVLPALYAGSTLPVRSHRSIHLHRLDLSAQLQASFPAARNLGVSTTAKGLTVLDVTSRSTTVRPTVAKRACQVA